MPNIDADALNNPAVNFENRSTDPTAPGSGRAKLYIKNGGAYVLLDTGDPVPVGGAVALAEGQLAVGDGSGVLSALAVGTEGQLVTADASGFATWADAPEGGSGALTKIGEFVATDSTISSHTFSDIAQTYRHLQLVIYGRSDLAGQQVDAIRLRFNADSGQNYTSAYSYSSLGAAAVSDVFATNATGIPLDALPGATATASYANLINCTVGGYRAPFFKPVEWRCADMRDNQSANTYVMFGNGQWRNTDAITSLTVLTDGGGHFVTGTIISLYGLS